MDSTLEITRSAQPACTRITAWPALTVPCPLCVCLFVIVCTGICGYLLEQCHNMHVGVQVCMQGHMHESILIHANLRWFSCAGFCLHLCACELPPHVGVGEPPSFRKESLIVSCWTGMCCSTTAQSYCLDVCHTCTSDHFTPGNNKHIALQRHLLLRLIRFSYFLC